MSGWRIFISSATLSALMIALGTCSGCSITPSDVTNALAQLKNDPATVCITVVTPAGTMMATRTNQPSSTVKPGCDIAQGAATTPSAPVVVAAPPMQVMRP